MSVILIDTNIASFIFKGSVYIEPYEPLLNGHELALSFMSIAELYQWAFIRQWGDRRIAQLEYYLSSYLAIPIDDRLCKT
jgi:tRNA(fMet)-specific endonuclease VapC